MKYLIKYELINSKKIITIMSILYVINMYFSLGLIPIREEANKFINPLNTIFVLIFIIWRGSKLIKDLNPEHNVIEHMISIDKDKFIIAKILSSIILFAPLFVIMLLIALVFGFKLF
ncbi:hypothetical protein SAMN05444401_3944 [Clostridium amylolyticum]|uniref:Uncharacterized protein n=1 Tax=Clostridium amylolyticum TaxID=1121298 RepID=A0A1M6MCN8_9CLOT|nr:hypothetical protein [Clostridium amylolyticum]SHJ81167.1 hypothetical protein SAMN05444401_3944 [Clostridium amylolyticum]